MRSPHTKRQKRLLEKTEHSILMAYVDGRRDEWKRLRRVRDELADAFARWNKNERRARREVRRGR